MLLVYRAKAMRNEPLQKCPNRFLCSPPAKPCAASNAKLGTVLVLNKVLAVWVGPSGYAVIGQFQSVVAMVALLRPVAMASSTA